MSDSANPVNSRQWWENYFANEWDANSGSEQTRHFMECLIANLPASERLYLETSRVRILDWGCAFGEGVELLARSFPQSQVTGLDFASRAIEQARLRHPEQRFVQTENGEIPGEFDVILTSNCLEHFENPLEIMRAHLRLCRNLYILLVPYNEFPLSEHHRTRFTEDLFPEHLGRFVRLCARGIDVDSAYWNGQQLLVAYGSESYVRERTTFARKASEQDKWDQYYASLPLYGADEATQAFGDELVERISELLPAGGTILEAGCGGGWQSLALARSGKFQVSLMDFSREALQYARRLFEREKLTAEFIYGDVFIPGEPQFDLSFNAGVLEHYTLKEQAAFLRGMASHSRNYVLALVPNRLCYWYWLWRIQKSATGDWPFGKEVPLADFSAAFQASGLQFLGQTFMGERWADSFVEELAGITPQLKKQLLEITRSPLTPKKQKSYLVAGLGAVAPQAQELPRVWTPSPAPEDMQMAEMHAALADALALRIGEEQRLSKLQAELSEKDRAIEMLTVQVAATERRAMESEHRAIEGERHAIESEHRAIENARREAEKENGLQELARQLSEHRGVVASLTAQLAEHEEARSADLAELEKLVKSLTARLSETERTANAFSAKAVEAEQATAALTTQLRDKEGAISSLSAQLAQKERELEKINSTLGWRLLNAYGPIKYRYLLPIHRMLGLAPYKRESRRKKLPGHTLTPASANSLAVISQVHALPGEPAAQAGAVQELDELRADLSRESTAYDVVCFPIIDWDFRFQRPQQLMSRFAAAGHRVFYVSQRFRSSGAPYTLQQKAGNIYEVSLRGPELNIYTHTMDDRARDSCFAALDSLRGDLSLGATAAIVQLPFWWPLARQTRANLAWPVVYDCMDYHAGFSTNSKRMIGDEEDLMSSADLVIVSSAFLETKARRHNSNVLLVRNGCDYEHFASVGPSQNARPVIGYYGAIAEWFDSDLVADLAERRPDWDFLLVGSTFSAEISRLSKLSNVRLPGEKSYSEIPEWLGRFDVAIIPFKRTPLTEATDPVKAYEILASGKPLVSVPIPEMSALSPLVRLASSSEEFEKEIGAALAEKEPELVEQRRAFAEANTWEKRYEALAPSVGDAFPKASIIVVTFNNLDLNRLCLESIYARTEWPNFEVIVVDNASTDGTPEYLKEAENAFPNLRVVLNESNLGFAAANNIGLRQATGDYLVLLNNDTVVTRSWLSALIRHLYANPKIGMIGPVTNAVGNEAKVEVGYTQLDEMPAWAANYAREHDEQVFPIPMLAMFCVAMRKEVFEKVGLLDERFEVGMFEDDDYCRRLRDNGYELRCALDSFVHHWQRASFRLIGEDEYIRVYEDNRRKYESKWKVGESYRSTGKGLDREQLKDVLARVSKSKGAIVFLPSIGWNINLFQRPHHLAREFARQGYVSIFDSSNSQDDVRGFKEIETNLFLYHGSEEVLREVPDSVLWTFVYNFDRKDTYANSAQTVYDCIDDLQVFPYDREFLERNHHRGLAEASIVTCVSRRLHEQALAVRSDAIYLPNGVEYERFATKARLPQDSGVESFLSEGKPIAGYYGAFANWFDYDLLEHVARMRPDWNFLLIGQMLDQSLARGPLLAVRNVKWIGPREYKSLPGYLQLFDVAMIPFVINDITVSTSPLKLYEYMAGGKPVITTPMPECQGFPEVLIALDPDEFSQALDIARERASDAGFRSRLRATARENSWERRVQHVVGVLRAQENAHSRELGGSNASEGSSPGKEPCGSERNYDDPAVEIAKRFARFRHSRNGNFFDALAIHLSQLVSDPCLPMYFEYAITCNERGREVANLLSKYTKLRRKRYLDVGCAYGGFLVALAERGAKVTGIDNDESLLGLARHNLADNRLEAPLVLKDATRSSDLVEFRGNFDIITCNDVIEHVDDPQATLCNISDMLKKDGIAYLEIPNRYHPGHVLRDGHYQLFGITLLDYPEASEYYSNHSPGTPYTVRHYLELKEYESLFDRVNLRMIILEQNFENASVEAILEEAARLRARAPDSLKEVPFAVRQSLEHRLSSYLDEIESSSRTTDKQKREFILRYGISFWRVLGQKIAPDADSVYQEREGQPAKPDHASNRAFLPAPILKDISEVGSLGCRQHDAIRHASKFKGMPYHRGRCNVCGNETAFYYESEALYRESLTCGDCLTTSRYRSIARGILIALEELTGIVANSIAGLQRVRTDKRVKIYDTQGAFYFERNAYPIPDLLSKAAWIDVDTSIYQPNEKRGKKFGRNLTNQDLEALTFPDNSFDIVVTSDVMEHVRLDARAHHEIRRVLRPGGVYLFTVPHFRDRHDTFFRVAVVDPGDPSTDIFLTEKEYHGNANSEDGRALSYRSYGTDIDEILAKLGFTVEYSKEDLPGVGIMNTELFFCRLTT